MKFFGLQRGTDFKYTVDIGFSDNLGRFWKSLLNSHTNLLDMVIIWPKNLYPQRYHYNYCIQNEYRVSKIVNM